MEVKYMGGCGGFPFLGRGRGDGLFGFGGLGGCGGGCNWGGCGGCGDDKKIAVITAVRAIVAKGDGCFDGKWWD
jgi:hypothetical protein